MAGATLSSLPVDLGDDVVLRHYEMKDLDALWAAIEDERERLGVWMPWILREGGRGTGGFYDLAVYGLLDREWVGR